MKTNEATTLEAGADPGLNFYYAVVREHETETTWQSRLVANCSHHHRTREGAERCGEKILRDLLRDSR